MAINDAIEFNENVDETTANLQELREKLPQFFTKDVFDEQTGELLKKGTFDLEKFIGFVNVKESDKIDLDLEAGFGFNFLGKQIADIQAAQKSKTVIVPDTEHNNKEENKNSKNLFFTGDNLDVLQHLQNNYRDKVDFIYIDPPYNTGSDGFVYPDNFQFSDEQLQDEFQLSKEQIKRLHSINHSASHPAWMTFMYPRLKLAKMLLKDNGVIFVSIDDHEQAQLKMMMDDIFGEDNLLAQLVVQMSKVQGMKVASAQKGNIVKNKEFVIGYVKNIYKNIDRQPLYDGVDEYDTHYSYFMKSDLSLTNLSDEIKNTKEVFEDIHRVESETGTKFSKKNYAFFMKNSQIFNDFIFQNSSNIFQDGNANLSISEDVAESVVGKEKATEYVGNNGKKYYLIRVGKGTLRQLLPLSATFHQTDDFYSEYKRSTIRGDWWADFNLDMMNINNEDGVEYKNGKKPVRLIEQLIKYSNIENGIVLDFFAGSGTTGSAVLRTNAKNNNTNQYILVQKQEDLLIRIEETKGVEKTDIEKLVSWLAEHERLPFIDQMTQQRLVNAANSLKKRTSNGSDEINRNIDLGFKHYTVVPPKEQALSTIKTFDPQNPSQLIGDKDMIDAFSSQELNLQGNASGEETILTSWLTEDGLTFDQINIESSKHKTQLGHGYYVANDIVYVLDTNWDTADTKELFNGIGNVIDELSNVHKIVLYRYALNFQVRQEFSSNKSQLKNVAIEDRG